MYLIQADCIIIVAVADQDPKVGEIEKQVDRTSVRAQKELVLLHKPKVSSSQPGAGGAGAGNTSKGAALDDSAYNFPTNTATWLNNRGWCTMHHHIRCKARTFSRKTPSRLKRVSVYFCPYFDIFAWRYSFKVLHFSFITLPSGRNSNSLKQILFQ